VPIDVAILGHGRFGRALADLAEDAGLSVRAFDPSAAVPENRRAASAVDAIRDAALVVVAVPVPAMPALLASIAPALTPAQLVLDVGSVKVHPSTFLGTALGDRIPWVATHPLFGPTSLALAERPLRVVICPNATHPTAAARARAFYERLGCWTIEQDAHAHDKAMAETHALAFFVAKGMLDAGVDTRVPFAPPSFQAIARTVDVVRGDAGHLFAAICADNPHAGDARKRLLDALAAVNAALDAPAHDAIAIAPATTQPAAPLSPELADTRDRIDELDQEIVALLGRRAELSRRAMKAKQRLGQPLYDPERETRVLGARRAMAEERGIDAESVEDVFRAILRFSRRVQG
jgi:prephenate dehydrogenase